MRQYLRILIGLVLLFFGYLSIKQETGGYDSGIFSDFNYIPFALVIVLTIVSFFFDSTYFRISRKLYQYSISFIGLIICLIIFFKIVQRISVDVSPTVLLITNKAGATNVLKFEFKNNNRFRLTEFDMLGQTMFYGKYSRSYDTLKIIESNYNGFAKALPETGIIKNDTVFWNQFDTMLVDKH